MPYQVWMAPTWKKNSLSFISFTSAASNSPITAPTSLTLASSHSSCPWRCKGWPVRKVFAYNCCCSLSPLPSPSPSLSLSTCRSKVFHRWSVLNISSSFATCSTHSSRARIRSIRYVRSTRSNRCRHGNRGAIMHKLCCIHVSRADEHTGKTIPRKHQPPACKLPRLYRAQSGPTPGVVCSSTRR